MTRHWGSRADRWFARRYDAMQERNESTWLGPLRSRLLGGLEGDVLELGAGTGVNRHHLPTSLRRLVLLEPSPLMRTQLVEAYRGHALTPEFLSVGDEALAEFPDASFDAVVCTLVLCSVADPDATATHLRRVLRPGGRLVVIEHVGAGGLAGRAQSLLTPLMRRVAHGCHLDRDTVGTLERAGFDVSGIARVENARPDLARPMIAGVSVVADSVAA